ncbi:uncharacterized protein IL334_005091 [Kwoniella shivajii]|uniref:Zn(2)-C6 fungal-type domain-containing protein n=1 Tax=Kwoniella shivajii TaxID=564305 RepID=A0ABZ1D2M9_9TREE|nr:hypothetical protein IL334_005091 [Kwoniella shivajii]
MEATSRATSSMAGRRRPRPHSYTTQACERCRNRKQRCVIGEKDGKTCRNCIESRSECTFSRAYENAAKRSRGESHVSVNTIGEDSSDIPEYLGSGLSNVPSRSVTKPMSAPLVADTQSQHIPLSPHFASTHVHSGNLNFDRNPSSTANHPTSTFTDSFPPGLDLQNWMLSLDDQSRPGLQSPPQGSQIQQHAQTQYLQSLPSYPRGSPPLGEPSLLPQSRPPHLVQPYSVVDLQAPQMPSADADSTAQNIQPSSFSSFDHTQSLPAAATDTFTHPPPPAVRPGLPSRLPTSPGSELHSEESLEDAAKGLAMISLEAAAEPHYVGESSGSLWRSVIAGGMHSQTQQLDGLRRGIHSTHRQVSSASAQHQQGEPSIAVIRQIVQRPIPIDTANSLLETVFRHLHPRYPFMDWVTFEHQWERRDEILSEVGQGVFLDRASSTAAFFILMILAVGAQLCKERPISGLLRPEDYYNLAAPYLSVIVTLHNLPNIQGLLLLAVYSLRDSKGPSVWYLSGVTLRLCVGMGLHRNAAGWAVRSMTKYEIEMRKRVFWSCTSYTLDRMMSLLLGRPPGISDDDFDVDLPELCDPIEKPKLEILQLGSMASAIHHIKLKRIESRIQRSIYSINRKGQATDYWEMLNSMDEWERTIPIEASSNTYWMAPSCSSDWFLLKGVEARLHLLRPLCAEGQKAGAVFVTHLAKNAARGCDIQKRMHQQGQPMSNASAHSAFICGLALLYAVFLQPKVLPLKDVFQAIKSTSNTLFAYTQHAHSAEVLYDVFEDLSSACIEHVSKHETKEVSNSQHDPLPSVDEWQKASSEATSNIDPTIAGEYVNLLQTLGITMGVDRPDQAPYTEPLWDLAAFTPGNLMTFNDIEYNGQATNMA